ncbi:GNAT family N-acetyltransferase [Streptomyces sp. NPDC091278]|uniref:GNAT family N-acetyltransferase n=1 Tax=Streptomyces sp. NPDC091278 TaxID=3155301 RepID=UPI00344BCDC0
MALNPYSDGSVSGWTEEVTRELKRSMPPGCLLSLCLDADDTVLELQILRVSIVYRGQGHASRVLARVCAEADARGLIVVCTPTDEFGADMDRLTDFYQRAGFAPVVPESRLTKHSWQRLPR